MNVYTLILIFSAGTLVNSMEFGDQPFDDHAHREVVVEQTTGATTTASQTTTRPLRGAAITQTCAAAGGWKNITPDR